MQVRRLVISLAVIAVVIAGGGWPRAQAANWGRAAKKKAAAAKEEDFELKETSGPWLIMAATFTGDGAEDQARQLVRELRKDLKQNAYTYRKKFDFSKTVEGRGVDRLGGPQMMRYERDELVVEIAVLVGDYEKLGEAGDDVAQRTLKKIKYMQPDALVKVEKTSQTLAAIHAIQRAAIPRDDKQPEKGPMGGAFLTTNPLLPRDYFVPKGLDKFVVDMNKGVKYSLLDCKGKYTVKVATFTGQNVLLTKKVVDQMEKGKVLALKSKLVDAAEKAHKLTETLRAKGVPAFEFHDRAQSIVTIGSFDSVGTPQPNGQIELNPQIFAIMQQYGAERSFAPGQTPQVGKSKTESEIPFDVQPLPVEVPRRSIGADYARRRRRVLVRAASPYPTVPVATVPAATVPAATVPAATVPAATVVSAEQTGDTEPSGVAANGHAGGCPPALPDHEAELMTLPALPAHTPLVLGTYNLKKLLELCELLAPLGYPLKMLTDFLQAITVEETGDTFAANAALKASEQAVHLGAWVLGEDSGLSVDALDGRPGVFSARYAGPGASDGENNLLLLKELAGVPHERRTAHYTCHVALSNPAGEIVARSEAYCRGLIRAEPAGGAGFGYDPLFEIAEYHRTFGELGLAVKRVLSHRARAVTRLVEMLT